MPIQHWIKKKGALILFVLLITVHSIAGYADTTNQNGSIDRIQLVTEQINLLKNRLTQAQTELQSLQHEEQIRKKPKVATS